ncbi:MAG: hypothetical protein SFX73_40840 [Kofleriaceae bacterium]|nr:hypothetical protein [Kofleriaceae bacterium]
MAGRRGQAASVVVAVVFAARLPAAAQPSPVPDEYDIEQLGKVLTNPIAPIPNIPFEATWNEGVGVNDDLQFQLKIEPVIPFSLADRWNLVMRSVLPFTSQPPAASGDSTEFGFDQWQLSLFLSPVPGASTHLLWGIGPILGLPTSSLSSLQGGTWQAGPTGVVRYELGPWTATLLVNQLWSFADTGDVEQDQVSQLFVQPIISYTRGSWTIIAESETTINWEASDDKWSLPLELYASKLTRFGATHLKVTAGGGWFPLTSSGGAEWRVRLAFALVFPPKR